MPYGCTYPALTDCVNGANVSSFPKAVVPKLFLDLPFYNIYNNIIKLQHTRTNKQNKKRLQAF